MTSTKKFDPVPWAQELRCRWQETVRKTIRGVAKSLGKQPDDIVLSADTVRDFVRAESRTMIVEGEAWAGLTLEDQEHALLLAFPSRCTYKLPRN